MSQVCVLFAADVDPSRDAQDQGSDMVALGAFDTEEEVKSYVDEWIVTQREQGLIEPDEDLDDWEEQNDSPWAPRLIAAEIGRFDLLIMFVPKDGLNLKKVPPSVLH